MIVNTLIHQMLTWRTPERNSLIISMETHWLSVLFAGGWQVAYNNTAQNFNGKSCLILRLKRSWNTHKIG